MELKKLSSLLLAFILTLCACSSNKSLSETERIRSAYPPSSWITATGTGLSPQDAQDQALANLARIFRSEVRSERISQTELQEYFSNREQQFTEARNYTDNTRIQTNLLMLNARILEEKKRSEEQYFAIAGINKLESSAIYDEEINKLSQELFGLKKQLNSTENAFQKLQIWWGMNQKVGLLETFIAQNNLISGFRRQDDQIRELILYVDEQSPLIKQQMTFHFKGDVDNRIKDEIIRHYEKAGFNYDASSIDPMMVLDCAFEQKLALTDRDDAVFYNWNLNIRHYSPKSKRRYSTFIVQDRSGSTTSTNALARMKLDISRRLQERLPQFIQNELINHP